MTNSDLTDTTITDKSKVPISKLRNVADTILVEIIPIILDDSKDYARSQSVVISDIYPMIADFVEDNETFSSVFLMINSHLKHLDEQFFINGSLLFYKLVFLCY